MTANSRRFTAAALILCVCLPSICRGQSPSGLQGQPVVARVEMKLMNADGVIDVIEKGDLLTVLREREDDYVISTHDGTKGAVAKVNALRVIESVGVYSELIKAAPKEGRYYTLRASAWWARGDAAKALQDFDQAIELGYTEPHAYSSRGLFHAANGDLKKAIADYDQAIKLDPKDSSLLINRAAIHLSSGQAEQALLDYDQAVELEPNSTNALHQRAIAHKSAGQLEEAANDFTKILELEPDDLRAIMGRGYLHFQQQKHPLAIADFGRAVELNPGDAVAWNNRGYNRYQVGEIEDAIADYRQAIQLQPEYALALQNLAWALATSPDEALRDPKKAIESAEAACKLSNYESVGDLSALAAACAAEGKFERAVGWQEKVVAKVDAQYKTFAEKMLQRYEQGKPFAADSDADASDR
ncbi:MAG: tetratricopeptide repeat protein [Planctomycetota bacterium]